MSDPTFEDMKALVVGAVMSQLSVIQMLPEPHRGRARKDFVETLARLLHKGGYEPMRAK